ncbi:S8 family peptidase [Kitasatospora sp. NPDC051853]|uniref:S8 family peptidase n=1 Tax=Kitasatospora sp. NPDC051853 TaxID=3364058 RepID=UPI0037B4139C
MRRFARAVSAALLLCAALTGAPAAAASSPVPVALSAGAVPDQYIVTLKHRVEPRELAGRLGISPRFTYGKVAHGFAAVLSPRQVEVLRRVPGVLAIEQDGVVAVEGAARPRGSASSWGLSRINQRALPLTGRFEVAHTGAGVTAYVLDSGIDFAHEEFRGRAFRGFDAVGDGRNGQDCHGHGTHVAGTVGGSEHGVARGSTLVSVRVLGCDGFGTWSGFLAGVDWVAQDAVQPAVLNGSLGGPHSAVVDAAVNSLAAWGVLPVLAAGNSHEDACGVSPAGARLALTVGATDIEDRQAGFSNHGPCLAMFAPGVGIVSAGLGGGSATMSGTSMAGPHVTGIAVLLKQAEPRATPAEIKRRLAEWATPDALTVSSTSPNLLAYTAGL